MVLPCRKQFSKDKTMHRQILFISARSMSTRTRTRLNVGNMTVVSDKLEMLEQKAKVEATSKPDNWDSAKPFTEIPGPKPLPFIGNAWRFLPHIGDLHHLGHIELSRRIQQYGDVAILRNVAGRNLVFVHRPEDIENVHRNEGIWPERYKFMSLSYYVEVLRKEFYKNKPASLVLVDGNKWHISRSMANPVLMQVQSVKSYIPEMNRVVDDFIARIRFLKDQSENDQMPDDFITEMGKWALESVSFIALDKRLGCLENELHPDSDALRAIQAVHDLFDCMFKLDLRPSLWRLYSTTTWKKFVKARDTLAFIYHKYINEAKMEYDKKPKMDNENKSMLQKFLDINEDFAIIMATDLLTAGVDTTGNSMAAILYLLAKNKDVQEKLRKELKELLPQKDTPVTNEILDRAQYVRATIKEGQRVAGVVPINSRITTKDLVVGGYQIPKGTDIQLNNFVNLMSEKQFPQPEKFIPERWLRTNRGEFSHKNAHPFSFLPFGYGPRTCIGKRLAFMEMEVLLAKLIRNFEFEWPHPPAKFTSKVLYAIADPLKFRVKEVEN